MKPSIIPAIAVQLLAYFLFEPSKSVKSRQARSRARSASLVFVLAGAAQIVNLAFQMTYEGRLPLTGTLLLLPLLIAYALTRTRYFNLGIVLGLMCLWLTIPVASWSMSNEARLQLLIIWPLAAVLVAQFMYSRAAALTTFAFTAFSSYSLLLVRGLLLGEPLPSIGFWVQIALCTGGILILNLLESRKTAQQYLDVDDPQTRLRRILDNVAEIVIRVDDSLVIDYVSRAATNVLGYEPHEYEGRSLYSVFTLLYPDDVPEAMRVLRQVLDSRTSITSEFRWRHKDGHYIWLETVSRFLIDDDGKLSAILFTGRDVSDRKLANQALNAAHQRYERLVKLVDGMIWEIDAATFATVFVSPQAETMFGFKVEDILSDPLFWVYHIAPEHWQAMADANQRAIRERKGYTLEYRLIAADGSSHWLRGLVRPVIQNDQVTSLIGINIEISDLKEAQAAEQAQRRLAEAVSESVAALAETIEQDEVLDRILTQARNIFGADAGNIMMLEGESVYVVRDHGYSVDGLKDILKHLNMPLLSLPNLRWMLEHNRARALPMTAEHEDWVTVLEVGWIESHVSAPIRLDGRIVGFINLDSRTPGKFAAATAPNLQTFADQAAIALRNAQFYSQIRRYAEELEYLVEERTNVLEQERRQLQAILNAMTEGVAYTEIQPTSIHVKYINRALTELVGYDIDEWDARLLDLLQVRQDSENFLEQIEVVLRNVLERGVWQSERVIERSDGTTFDASVITTRVDKADGDLAGVVTVLRDISREKALAEQRARFVAHASHELRTPITNLITRLHLFRRRPDRAEEHLAILDEVAERMVRLVDDLLDGSRLERGMITLRRQPQDVRHLIDTIVRHQRSEAERKSIDLVFDASSEPLMVNCDAERLKQVFTNLIVNAINYTPEQGKIAIYVRTQTAAEAQIVVEDTGPGIPQEHLPHIFQPFFRVPNENEVKGSGLGLSIAHELVELHGGTLKVESEIGSGSRFIVCLPLSVVQETL